jgi:hypothetical protein
MLHKLFTACNVNDQNELLTVCFWLVYHIFLSKRFLAPLESFPLFYRVPLSALQSVLVAQVEEPEEASPVHQLFTNKKHYSSGPSKIMKQTTFSDKRLLWWLQDLIDQKWFEECFPFISAWILSNQNFISVFTK